ncbi:hypothetical protein [Enterococcus hirae]|uniref:hypothetical protein n=1 Tax=Enterococcus hirae TaxID=1354 RepID=UPI0013788488|nr:hypothetical protein [Enterococcus hirae]NBA40336.1 hypothetical protein [Enterococcus hirae]NBA56607.1 hypothetical protein [Enterococcus hirae]
MGKIVDFNRGKLESGNPLINWQRSFIEELKSNGYSTSISDIFFPSGSIYQFSNFYDLNLRITSLKPGEKLVLFRNHHFELFFYYSYENQLTLRIGTLVSGIDAMLLENRFSEEKRIFTKYYRYMLEYFGKE